MGYRISMSIYVDSHSDDTLNRGPLALLLRRQYEFLFWDWYSAIFIFIFSFECHECRCVNVLIIINIGSGVDCSSELHVTMSEGEAITSVSASEFSVAVTLSSGKVKLYTWTDIWDGSGTVSHSTITGNIAQVTSCSIYLLVWAIINIFNKKHSENSDTFTSVTFDLGVWPWPYVKVKKTYFIRCRL